MYEVFGNCGDIINWQELINQLEIKTPSYIGPRHREDDDIIGISDISKKWKEAGYVLKEDGGSVSWDMFLPINDFDKKIVDDFSDIVGIDCMSAWISRVRPGHYVPQHWDANDNEDEYNKIKNVERYSCNISKPAFGHILILEDDIIHNQPQGTIVKWPDRKSWHGSFNIGIENKYLFNIFGRKR